MWPWLKRILGSAEPPPQPGPGAARPLQRPVVAAPLPSRVPLVPEAVAEQMDAAATPEPGYGPRRPLVDRQGQVAGFELRLAPAAERFLASRGDTPGAVVHHASLLATAAAITGSGRLALLRLPAAMLSRARVADQVGAGMLLLVDGLQAVPAETAAALRQRGARLGVVDGPPSPGLHADFVVVEAVAGGLDTLMVTAQRWREHLSQVDIVGLGFEDIEDMETALRGAVTLAGGQVGRSRGKPPARPLGAAAHRICELLNHLVLDHDTAVVADAVRGDAALSYRLLRYANSPAVGARRGVEAIDDALQLLGRRELQRWLAVQLMLSAGSARQAAKALEEAALVRGRVLERLAQQLGENNPGAHFTLGLLSVIEPLLQVPLADAILPLRLGDEVQAALLRREGPWAPRLQLLDLLEGGDIAGAQALAQQMGVDERTLAVIVDDAWGWSALVAASAGAG